MEWMKTLTSRKPTVQPAEVVVQGKRVERDGRLRRAKPSPRWPGEAPMVSGTECGWRVVQEVDRIVVNERIGKAPGIEQHDPGSPGVPEAPVGRPLRYEQAAGHASGRGTTGRRAHASQPGARPGVISDARALFGRRAPAAPRGFRGRAQLASAYLRARSAPRAGSRALRSRRSPRKAAFLLQCLL